MSAFEGSLSNEGSSVVAAAPALDRPSVEVFPASQLRLVRWNVYVSLLALFVGGLFGLFQALERLQIDIFPLLSPVIKSYYQGLTLHGVLLVLVFTTAFINGFMSLATMRGFGRAMSNTTLMQAAFGSLLVGVGLAGWAMLTNKATVMFTFYPPLNPHFLFYLGLVLVVLSTWMTSANQMLTLRDWRREHPQERVPLMAFISIITYLMWDIASVGIAIEVVFLLIPWSLGLVQTTDPQLDRTLFWLSGHPIVYFWLLPAYVSWYVMVPRQVGGRLFSDPLVRVVFVLFLVLSAPVGFHHQFTESGIPAALKMVHGVFTFAVFFPSMVTAFTVIAALEVGGRARGGKGLLGWIWHLPWGNPSVTAQLLAMIVFVLGGASGLINASQTVNLVVHNTSFIVGHFHMTVGTAVALSFIGISFWLVPYLTGKALWGKYLALATAWFWAIGVMVFARGQIIGGIEGIPRRTAIANSAYLDLAPEWTLSNITTGIGGIIMVVGGVLFLLVLLGTLLGWGGRTREAEIPVTESLSRGGVGALWLDDWKMWLVIAVLLILIAYLPFFITYLPPNFTSPAPAFQLW